MSYRLTLFFLLLVSPLQAAPPTLKLPEKVTGQVGQFISIRAETTGKSVSWYSLDGLGLFPPELLRDSTTAVVVASQPGLYRLIAVTAVADEVSPLVVCTILIEGTAPSPTPPPLPAPPQPTPTPTPPAPTVTGKLYAVIVEDPTARTPAIAQVINSIALRDALGVSQGQGFLRVVGNTDPFIKAKNLDQALTKAGRLPAFILQDESGTVHQAVPLPTTEAEAVQLVKKLRGN